ncbi:hypothetical protein [Mycoplasma leonicaptivi]|uniref:hypothetical protein n=1 Tax=Mycoplasma leonicaptivi TaxID=36742 RepID=UPI0012EB9805|nr:hypothetical protein [Mycoplasma leonicaptivi]
MLIWNILQYIRVHYNSKSLALGWFYKTNKIKFNDAYKKICSLLLSLFILCIVLDHMSVHYIYGEGHLFDFQTNNLNILWTKGWWNSFYNSAYDRQTQSYTLMEFYKNYAIKNNVGFIFDAILNVLYYATLSPVFNLVVSIGFTSFALINFLFLDTSLKSFLSKKCTYKDNLKKRKERVMRFNSALAQTPNVLFWLEFLKQVCWEYNIDFSNKKYKLIEKEVLKSLIPQKVRYLVKKTQESLDKGLSNEAEVLEQELQTLNLEQNEIVTEDIFDFKNNEQENHFFFTNPLKQKQSLQEPKTKETSVTEKQEQTIEKQSWIENKSTNSKISNWLNKHSPFNK